MFDINGFLASTEFLAQLASLITAILSTLLSDFINIFLGSV